MRRLIDLSLVAAVLWPAAHAVAQAPPSTDIYLAPLSRTNGSLAVGTPVNVTNRPGYDNQPSFTPDGRAMLYTSTRDDGQSDIYRYDVATHAITRLTATPESEYSATTMPGGSRFSVIRVERDSTQRLWSFAVDGTRPELVIASLRPVGYHVWLDASRLAMFVLGRPNALVIGDLRTMRMDTVARNIGRSLARLPDGRGFSYAQIVDSTTTLLRGMDPASHQSWDIVPLPRGAQDIVWLSDGTLIAASGTTLLAWRQGRAQWDALADLSAASLTDASRLAVSADEKWIAIVAAPRAK